MTEFSHAVELKRLRSRRIAGMRMAGMSYEEIAVVLGTTVPKALWMNLGVVSAVYGFVLPDDREMIKHRDTPKGFYGSERFGLGRLV
jgi:hypothetical protein